MKIMGGPYTVKEHVEEGNFEAEIFHVEMSALEIELIRKISGITQSHLGLPNGNEFLKAIRPLLALTEAINQAAIGLHYLRKLQEEGDSGPRPPKSGAV